MRKKQDGTPHPYQFRVTHRGQISYVFGRKKADAMPGRKEVVTYRLHVWLPEQRGDRVELQRKSVYGESPALCYSKAESLRKAAPFVLDLAQNTVGIKLGLASLRMGAEVLEKYDSGEWSMPAMQERIRAKNVPTIRALAESAIEHKRRLGKNVVSDKTHLNKLSLPFQFDGAKLRFGNIKAHEVSQRHLVEWVKMISLLPGKKDGETLSPHSIDLAIALVKSAWQQLQLGEFADLKDRLAFNDLGVIYRQQKRKMPNDKAVIPLDTLKAIAELDLSKAERGAFALLLAGIRPNEVGAVRPQDIVSDDAGRLWLEPMGSVGATGREWRDGTKTGHRDNRSIPLSPYQARLIADCMDGSFIADDGSGLPLGTRNVRDMFRDLVSRAGKSLGKGEDVGTMRHTVITAVTQAAGMATADAFQHAKLPNTMAGKHYTLLEIRELRRLSRPDLMRDGKPVCDLLPWAEW